MPPPRQEPIGFDWWDTPDPTERGFMVEAEEQDRNCTIPDFLNNTVLWTDCPAWIKHAHTVITDLQDYRLIHAAKAGRMRRAFYFARVRTQLERDTAFKTRWVKRMHSWPTVLLKLWAKRGSLDLSSIDSAGDIQTASRILERATYRPGGMYPTWFRIRHFLSEVPFPRKGAQIVPITDSIQWSYDGTSGSFPECLHPGVTVPEVDTGGEVIFNFGTPQKDIGSDLYARVYPPTNMQDWEKYPIEDTRNEVMGTMEHRILVEAYPPIDDREVKA